MSPRILLTIDEAAEAVGQSARTIERAIRATDPASYPPPLNAKRLGSAPNARKAILLAELQRWAESLPDA